ncbi:hypothetical protein GQ53DRAFT_791831 [Thozetella sp. PMI_491]|nr:hypothetical protein GQ53DRAFT_791831 [Thozetella sp. PMI_491]
MSPPSACAACRSRRRKCNISAGRLICTYCDQRNIPCVWEPPQGGYYGGRTREQERHDDEHPPLEGWPSYPLRLHLATLYFDFIHDQNHSIFHRPTFLEDLSHQRVPHSILCAIFALSARFSADPFFADTDPRKRGQVFFEQGQRLVCLSEVSLHTIRLCILLGTMASAEGNPEVENIFYGVAGRMAQLLDLPRRPASSTLEREVNIRVWWSLCMIDVWSSTAVKLPKVMPPSQDVPLPIDELSFLALQHGNEESSTQDDAALSNNSQLLSQMVKLNRILSQINDFNQRCVVEDLDQHFVIHEVQEIELKLEQWRKELPENMRDHPDNLAWFASRGLGRVYVAVFLGFYHFGQLLFYQFLHGEIHEPALPAHRGYADRCKMHAAHLCDMIYRAFATPGCDVLYAMVAHVLVIASTVQIHTLLTSPDEEAIRMARERLEKNFEVLLSLRPYWPMLDRVMSRLRAFHETCRSRMDASFVLDRWMLRFLEEPGELMEGKYLESDAEALWNLDGIR